MHNFFKKINLSFNDYDESLLKGAAYQTYPFGLTYYHIADQVIHNELRKYSPIEPDLISYMEIENSILPHRDVNGTVVLNFYIQSGPGKTNFYKLQNYNDTEHRGFYDYNCCHWQNSFIASDRSCYLLNVGEIHDVVMLGSQKRKVISFGYPNYLYEEVVEQFKNLWVY